MSYLNSVARLKVRNLYSRLSESDFSPNKHTSNPNSCLCRRISNCVSMSLHSPWPGSIISNYTMISGGSEKKVTSSHLDICSCQSNQCVVQSKNRDILSHALQENIKTLLTLRFTSSCTVNTRRPLCVFSF